MLKLTDASFFNLDTFSKILTSNNNLPSFFKQILNIL